jgi:photosystem II stability/assembly factor-like uncharacterized protein
MSALIINRRPELASGKRMLRPDAFAPIFSAVVLLLVSTLLCRAQSPASGEREDTLKFRFLGPQIGNRIAAVAGVPGDPSTYYAGAASGGVWKSTDGGNRFTAVFDDQPAAAIGALAVAPSDPAQVWAGTGEAWAIRDSDVMGNGIYKSTDAGKTWKHMGLDETGRIGRIVVHPKDPDTVFVCALGRTTGPQQERGVFRTKDGGVHWDRVLFADEKTGCSGLVMDPHNSSVLFAGMWQVEMHTYGEFSGGPGSGVYVSRDGGATWTRLTGHGLPKPPVGKIDLAIAPSDSNRVYALIQTATQGSLWRSDDEGENWRVSSHSRALIGRAGYYIRVAVSPLDEDEVLVASSSVHQSFDGGETFRTVPWGGDTHDIWFDPTNANRFVITDDAGMNITTAHGRGFHRVQLPIGQMYHVATDNQVPYWIYTNMQDDGTMRGPSSACAAPDEENPEDVNTRPVGEERELKAKTERKNEPGAEEREASANTAEHETGSESENLKTKDRRPHAGGLEEPGVSEDWEHGLGGCESGFTLPDPTNPDIVWASCYGDEVTRYNAKTKEARSVSPWLHTLDSPPNQTKYRCHWTPPLAIDPFDHNTVYYGCQIIFKTSNGGQSWSVISPDLSTQDPTRIVPSGGIIGDNLGQFYGEVVFAIAPSPLEKGLIWAGTNDGKVWYTRDGDGHWNDVTKNIGMPAWGTISKIQPSNFDPASAYIAVDYHLMDNRDPFIYKTSDFGKSWQQISSNLPKGPLAYVKSVSEDPNHKGLLFAGTGNAFYYSLNDGGSWTQLQTGLPHAPVTWIEVQKNFRDVVVSTYGRGIYILDDITPLEQMADQAPTEAVLLYKPRSTYRLRNGRAYVNFALKSGGPVEVKILDRNGKVVRDLKKSPGHEGLNRRTWDLRYDPPELVKLRTSAPDNPFIWEETRFRTKDSRPITHWGLKEAEVGPLVIPGKYIVQIEVGDKTYTEPIEIQKDPKAPATEAELEASLKMQLRIRDAINAVSKMVNRIEWMRKQLDDVENMLHAESKAEDNKSELAKSVHNMNLKMQDVEFKLISRVEANSDDKYFVEPYKIYLNLLWLNGEVGQGAGDVAGGVSYGPTDTSMQILDMLEKDLATARAEYNALTEKEVPAFNRAMLGNGITPVNAGLTPAANGGKAAQ